MAVPLPLLSPQGFQTPAPSHPPGAITGEGTDGLGQSWWPPSRAAAPSPPPLPQSHLPAGPAAASCYTQVSRLRETSGVERRTPSDPSFSQRPLCTLEPRGPGSARAAPLPSVRRSGIVSAGQPGALAAIQGGERRGKRRAGEGRGGEPRAQEQRRAPHRPAPRTLAGFRDARAAAWAHQPGHLVPEGNGSHGARVTCEYSLLA